ncbi:MULTISPECIES: hypothetical protein [Halomonadaceae]|jgi:hypothetical protein|uniref:Uncharacterized protein n=1 Tax=Vreelandella piezotolerans TaxID=2609667 RepID=A0ABQ6X4N8_9GAMM|nr:MULTISPECIES: hypothetical protein [Halomonas]KAE8436992.1 hypothetical protein F1978_16865 [Halomonas piezotolerans]QJA22966.1 hypothetical protein GYM47_01995 [Halomonas piezotolerans]|tara:strand:+ start:12 stop:5411 length:5400 start_codon:yes stop_codon:yes gene_type:complete
MSQEVVGNCHNEQLEAVTVSLGKRFRKLVAWSNDEDLLDVLQVIYHALGLSPRNDAIANLVRECSHPESIEILASWAGDPLVDELQRFVDRFNADHQISREYPVEAHAGDVEQNKRQFQEGGVTNKTFLITMTTNPQAQASNDALLFWRRLLRLWLVVHALHRIAHQKCIADRHISDAARFITIGPYDEKWQMIDALLRRCRSFVGEHEPTLERVNDALIFAINEIRLDYSNNRAVNRFFNSVTRIARGEVAPINNEATAPLLRIERFVPPAVSVVHHVNEEGEDTQYQFYAYRHEARADLDPEEDEGTYVATVDPSESNAEQQLASRSYFVQTAEASHFLPWSWEKLLPPEQEVLLDWIDQGLFSLDSVDQLGAVMVWLSVRFSRTLYFAEQFRIDDTPGDEWTLAQDFSSIARTSPRRANAWQGRGESLVYIYPLEEVLSIELPTQVASVLQQRASQQNTSPIMLRNLWEGAIPLERWFYQQAQSHFPRVTSAKLAHVWGQVVFDRTQDPHLARLLSAHPNAGLPGASSYATWDITAIEKGLSLGLAASAPFPPSVNLIGSRLSPITSLLRDEIAQARSVVEKSAEAGLVHYHNALAQYCVMGLYAATGGRFLRDPFESLQHFNLSARCLYLNDKMDQGRRSSRVVPLPHQAVELVHCYISHLQSLAIALDDVNPMLAEAVYKVLAGDGLSTLPFFFLLDESLSWHSTSTMDLPSVPLFQWPLPSNVFRHRYAQQLRYLGVPAEVVDGWMGHAERSVASYGDFSPRCWQHDADAYAREVDTAFDGLGFLPPTAPTILPGVSVQCLRGVGEAQKAPVPRPFGQRLREKERRRTIKREHEGASKDIDVYLGGGPLSDIQQADVDTLVQRMLHRNNSVIHPYASLRLSVLLRRLEEEGSRYQYSINKRVAEAAAEKSLITALAVKAVSLLPSFEQWAENLRKTGLKAQFSKLGALSVGALLLCLEKRISYPRMLLDVAQGRNYRLIQHQRDYLLEYSESLDMADYRAPAQRHRVSYKTASLLAAGQGLQKEVDLSQVKLPGNITSPPEALKAHQPTLPEASVQTVLTTLSELMCQANLLTLPGLVSGALAGRVPSTSLPLVDELRIRDGNRFAFPTPHDTQHDMEVNLSTGVTPSWRDMSKVEQQKSANRLYTEVLEVLKGYTKRQSRRTASQLDKLTNRYEGEVSACVMLLVRWISFLMRRGKVGKQNDYAQSSLTRYFSSLKTAFAEFGYQTNLVDHDEEEVTALYAKMLTFVELASQDVTYFSHRLRDFHAWAETLGVASPDWQELSVSDDRRSVRPGMLVQSEYLACQSVLLAKWRHHSDETFLLLGFVLLLTFRFGLRAQEAIGLQRSDWCEHQNTRWVLIRDNAQRKLKSDSSRRAVPLLFALDGSEENIIEQVFSRFTSLAGNDVKRPILCELYESQARLISWSRQVSPVLIQLLRQGTSSDGLTLHHCRHAFYNTLAPALFGINTALTQSICKGVDARAIRQQVLGANHTVSRRSGMASARLMGHRHPRIGLLNYSHCLFDWADQLTPVCHQRARKIAGVLHTGNLRRLKAPALEQVDITVPYAELTFTALWKMLRFVGLGMSYERAGQRVNISPENIETIAKGVRQAESHMRFKVKNNNDRWVNGETYPYIFLRSLGEKAWRRFFEHIEKIKESDLAVKGECMGLNELPFLISKNRQLLMSHETHLRFFMKVLALFGVPKQNVQVVSRNMPDEMVYALKDNGLHADDEIDGFQLDPFPIVVEGVLDRRQQYAALRLKRSPVGTVRNSHELAVAVLACGLFGGLSSPALGDC